MSHKCILTIGQEEKCWKVQRGGCALFVSVISNGHRVVYVYHIRDKVPDYFIIYSIHPALDKRVATLAKTMGIAKKKSKKKNNHLTIISLTVDKFIFFLQNNFFYWL